MATNTIKSSGTLEDKRQVISRKVWDLETTRPQRINIYTNGSVPYEVQKKIAENTLYPTNYVDENKKRIFLIKLQNKTYKLKIGE